MKKKKYQNPCLEDSAIFWPFIVKCLKSKHSKITTQTNHSTMQLSYKVLQLKAIFFCRNYFFYIYVFFLVIKPPETHYQQACLKFHNLLNPRKNTAI
jgi:hypothetical protein